TGLAPGIHINLIAAFLLASASSLPFSPLALVTFIVALSLTHVILDFIPSIYLGVPEEDSFLAVLPGHQLLLEGRAHDALIYTLYGAFTGLIILILVTPIYILFLPALYTALKTSIPFILIFISFYLVLREERPFFASLVFILSGLLGLLTFHLPVKEPLFPLLTGLFGLSSLFLSVKNTQKIKKQKILPLKKITLSKKEAARSFLGALISAPFCSFLPGIGSGHAAVIGSEIVQQNNRGFLALLGAINVLVMSLSFVAVYAISRARSGSAAAIQDLLKTITLQNLFTILIVVLISIILASFIALYISKKAANLLNKINYSLFCKIVIILLVILTFIFSSWLGLIILLTATSVGIVCIRSNSRRINLMASLILPAIYYYLWI
ncbi:tripartite tricarboxylate transporter permease, partial [Candidatus Pacearchaeota archaeon]|nr:tripartite tricarboxylate transporter permease [Candidatus Pacearchaeota archaeon]